MRGFGVTSSGAASVLGGVCLRAPSGGGLGAGGEPAERVWSQVLERSSREQPRPRVPPAVAAGSGGAGGGAGSRAGSPGLRGRGGGRLFPGSWVGGAAAGSSARQQQPAVLGTLETFLKVFMGSQKSGGGKKKLKKGWKSWHCLCPLALWVGGAAAALPAPRQGPGRAFVPRRAASHRALARRGASHSPGSRPEQPAPRPVGPGWRAADRPLAACAGAGRAGRRPRRLPRVPAAARGRGVGSAVLDAGWWSSRAVLRRWPLVAPRGPVSPFEWGGRVPLGCCWPVPVSAVSSRLSVSLPRPCPCSLTGTRAGLCSPASTTPPSW